MPAVLAKRTFFARGQRHQGEVYGAILAGTGADAGLAWRSVKGGRESLIYQASPATPPVVVARDTYILDPIYAGGQLWWIQGDAGTWGWRVAPLADLAQVRKPWTRPGRPLHPHAWRDGEQTWLVWEERQGCHTQVFLAAIGGQRLGEPVAITDGSYNAYDPRGARAFDGRNWLVYGAFREGNYQILLQALTPAGQPDGAPRRVNAQAAPCMAPAIAPARAGGVWLAYTVYGEAGGTGAPAVVQHPRRQEQLGIFKRSTKARVIRWHEDRAWAPLAPPTPQAHEGPLAAGIVHGASETTHLDLFEDGVGRLYLLARQHRDLAPVLYAEDQPLRRDSRPHLTAGRHLHAALTLLTLEDRAWSAPQTLLANGHLEEAPSWCLDDQRLVLGVCEDARGTGWNREAERYDPVGELGVGRVTVELPAGPAPDYQFEPLYLPKFTGISLVEAPAPPAEAGLGTLIFGQTHCHSTLSVCCRQQDREPHTNYRFMQDVQHCQFGGLTDHSFNFWDTEELLVRKLASYYYFPGEFIALPAYEWTGSSANLTHEGGPWGHVNPLWLADEGELPFHDPQDPECPGGSLPRLWQVSQDLPIIAPPHHTADIQHPFKLANLHPRLTPVVELFQDHRGCCEQAGVPGVANTARGPQPAWLLGALRTGRRFGFIGAGDHFGMALAGVYVDELTRSGLRRALHGRRCFASTGLLLALHLSANGQRMGAELRADTVDLVFSASASEPLRELQLVRQGETVACLPLSGLSARHQWHARRQHDDEFWYCRLLFENGEIAWTSPIWIRPPAVLTPA